MSIIDSYRTIRPTLVYIFLVLVTLKKVDHPHFSAYANYNQVKFWLGW